MSHSFDLIPMKRYEVEQLRENIAVIRGTAERITEDDESDSMSQRRARAIIRGIDQIRELMGWHTEAAEIREAVAASKNPDAHLGSEASE